MTSVLCHMRSKTAFKGQRRGPGDTLFFGMIPSFPFRRELEGTMGYPCDSGVSPKPEKILERVLCLCPVHAWLDSSMLDTEAACMQIYNMLHHYISIK